MSQEILNQIINDALADMPTAKWIAQDQHNGDWFAYETKPYYNQELMMWLRNPIDRKTNSLAFIKKTNLMPNNRAYEISKMLEKK